MYIRILALSIALSLASFANGQERSLIGFGIISEYNHVQNFKAVAGGIMLELKIGEVLSLNYRVYLGGGTQSRFFYVNTGITQAFGALINTAPLEDIAALAFIIPESFNFYIPLGDETSIIPYVAPYGFEKKEFARRTNKDDEIRLSTTVGCKFRTRIFDFGDFIPSLGAKYIYGRKKTGFVAGLDFIINLR